MTPEKPDVQHSDPLVVRKYAQGIADWRYENIYKGYVSPDLMTGLGRRAVAGALDAADYNMKGFVSQAERAESTMQPVIERVRANIDGLEEARLSGNNGIQELFQLEPMSPWLAQALDVEAHDNNITAALAARKPDGTLAVSDETLLNFLEWHNHALAERQSRLEQKTPEIKQAFERRFEAAIASGWIPESARANLSGIADVSLLVDDGLNTTTKGFDAATATPDGPEHTVIHFRPDFTEDTRVQTHELLHVVPGTDVAKGAFDHYGLVRLFGSGHGGKQMNEAIVEHLAASMTAGNIDTVDPSQRARGAYDNARGLLSTLTKDGVKPVDIRLFVNAYFENEGNEAQSRLWVALRRAFPFTDVLAEIDALEEADESTDEGSVYRYEQNLLQRADRYKRAGGIRGRVARFLKP